MFAAAEGLTLGILAGGAGRRLGGADKGLLAVQGVSQVQRIRAAFGDAPDAVLVSANRNLERYRALGFEVVEDRLPGFQGPLAGIAALLEACRTPWMLSVPVDAIRIPRDLVARLFGHFACTAESIAMVRVQDAEGLQPTLALYRSTLGASAAVALGAGVRSLQDWQTRTGCATLRVATLVGNRNLPGDFGDNERMHRGRIPT